MRCPGLRSQSPKAVPRRGHRSTQFWSPPCHAKLCTFITTCGPDQCGSATWLRVELTRGSDGQVVPSFRPSGSEAVTRCHLSGKENGRFPNAVGFTSSATCLLKLGGKGTRLEIKVRQLGVRTGFLTQEGFDGYIWGTFRQFAIISNLRRCFTPTQVSDCGSKRRSRSPQRTFTAPGRIHIGAQRCWRI